MNESNDDPKIIVDDDWKAQVAKEKEQLADQAEDDDGQPELPPASFPMLVSSLATQAMGALGFFPDPATGQAMFNKPMAKHLIDSLAVLEEKTKGNLTSEEHEMLEQSLHQLRMLYVNSGNGPAGPDDSASPEEPKSQIELP